MRFAHRMVALTLSGAISCLPGPLAAQTMIDSAFASVSTGVLAASVLDIAAEPQIIAFDWLANGAANATPERAKAALKRYRVINGSGSWICSPAGFGQRSVCYAG